MACVTSAFISQVVVEREGRHILLMIPFLYIDVAHWKLRHVVGRSTCDLFSKNNVPRSEHTMLAMHVQEQLKPQGQLSGALDGH